MHIRKKGIIEVGIRAMQSIVGHFLFVVHTMALKLRGYDVSWSSRIALSTDLFQSAARHIRIRSHADIRPRTRISAGFDGTISIGSWTLIDVGTCIMAQDRIRIGNNTLIAPYCFITDFNHAVSERHVHIREQGYIKAPVSIGDDVWIGTHSIILSGVTVGDGAVVGAGSVVTHDVPPHTIVAGNPARIIRKRFSKP